MGVQIDILLATYNGEKYLDEQIQSILEQDFVDYKIIARDDGSTDSTLNILHKWQALHPQKIEIVQDELGNLGPTQNFNQLMTLSKAPYICFSDQDDKWVKHKLAKQVEHIIKLEEKHSGLPVLVFSDLTLCDGELGVSCPSLIENDKLNPRATKPQQLLMQNVPYGCTLIINRRLLKLALPIDERALLHDHWLSILASLTGIVSYIDESLVFHRVHDQNASRAKSLHKQEASHALKDKVNNKNFHNYLFKQVEQAEALLERLEPRLEEKEKSMMIDFIALRDTKGLQRKWLIVKNRFFKNEFSKTIKLILRA